MTLETEKPQGETPRLEVTEISPVTLSQFIQSQEPTLELPQRPSYYEVLNILRDLPFSRQQALLVGFYTQEVENFPNGEKLGRFLAKIKNIAWFLPTEKPSPETLHQLSDEFYSRLNLPPPPLRIIEGDWDWRLYDQVGIARRKERLVAAWGTVTWDETDWTVKRKAVYDAAWNMARSAVPRLSEDIGWDAAMNATWIAFENLTPMITFRKGNPYELLFNGIYDKGYWFVGPMDDESVIFVPEIQTEIQKRLKLECFSGRGYDGSEEELKKFLSQIPLKGQVSISICRDLRVDLDTDYYTNSGYIKIHSIDELERVREKLSGAKENYYVSLKKVDDDTPYSYRSFYLKPSIKSLETFIGFILTGEYPQNFPN